MTAYLDLTIQSFLKSMKFSIVGTIIHSLQKVSRIPQPSGFVCTLSNLEVCLRVYEAVIPMPALVVCQTSSLDRKLVPKMYLIA